MGKNNVKERGSIEVVILVIVVAAIVGLVAWRIADTMKTQQDTEAATNNLQSMPPVAQVNKVDVPELEVKFEVPKKYGNISAVKSKVGPLSVDLISEKLKDAPYKCKGDNTGQFGALYILGGNNVLPAGADQGAVKEIDGKKFYLHVFFPASETLEDGSCYSDELMSEIGDEAADSIRRTLTSAK